MSCLVKECNQEVLTFWTKKNNSTDLEMLTTSAKYLLSNT